MTKWGFIFQSFYSYFVTNRPKSKITTIKFGAVSKLYLFIVKFMISNIIYLFIVLGFYVVITSNF